MSPDNASGSSTMGRIESLGYGIFQWIVGDIKNLFLEVPSEVRSPEVPQVWMGKIELKLQCELNSLNLRLSASLDHKYQMRFPIRASLVNCNSEEIHIFYISRSKAHHVIEEFVQRYMINQPVVYDFERPLTIKFEVYPLLGNIFKIPRMLQPLDLQLASFIGNTDFSDVKFNVRGTILHAHKVILSAASSFFGNLFRSQTPGTHDIINIDDLTIDGVKEMLRFIYTGKIDKIEVHKRELLAAAEKFDLPRLKFECVKYMSDTMNVSNAMEYLELSELFKSEELQHQAIQFIADNGVVMRKQPRFDSFTRLFPDSAQRLINSFFVSE